ncbi:hypothetical protein J6TS2_37730 [Heyndrickxia sporothermodurans]|nr:hypothetical protein J6TS2_37730 [Heyndrickxia sporothermodurans]
MKSFQAYFSFLQGNSYAIGKKQGECVKEIPYVMDNFLLTDSIDAIKYKEMKKMFDQFCPGLNEELQGFADSLNVNPCDLSYFGSFVTTRRM